ncbi:MAG: hypothetical protein OXR68_01055 [Alphaproteobacteria bacterium]|nr:hypothetical protein [Alphaproteobacteria bacterium]
MTILSIIITAMAVIAISIISLFIANFKWTEKSGMGLLLSFLLGAAICLMISICLDFDIFQQYTETIMAASPVLLSAGAALMHIMSKNAPALSVGAFLGLVTYIAAKKYKWEAKAIGSHIKIACAGILTSIAYIIFMILVYFVYTFFPHLGQFNESKLTIVPLVLAFCLVIIHEAYRPNPKSPPQ